MKYKKFWWSIILLLLTHLTFSQQKYTISNYSVNDGLAQSTVYSIIQDQRDFLWFATYGGGLCRFDGVKYKTYTTKDGLLDDKIYALLEDSKGNIWIGTRKGINLFNGYSFDTIKLNIDTKQLQIRDIIEDSKGIIWAATYGDGLIKIKNNQTHTYTVSEGLISNYLYTLEEIGEGKILIGTKNGISYFDGKRFTHYDSENEHQENTIRTIKKINDNRIIYGAFGSGVCELINNQHRCVPIKKEQHNENVMSILKARSGAVWVATFGEGLYKITEDSIYNINIKNSELPTNNILSLYEDALGNIWVGTFRGGVCKISETAFYSYTQKDGLDDPSIENLFQTSDGTIIMTSLSGEINQFKKEGGISNFEKNDKISTGRITSIIEDFEGSLWMGSDGDGIFKVTRDDVSILSSKNKKIPTNQVFSLYQSKDSTIWIGTYGDGIIEYKDGEIKNYKKEYERGLMSNQIIDIKEDARGLIWFATTGGGITSYDGINFKGYDLGVSDFASIQLDIFNNIWFASVGGGVFMYNGIEFENFNTDDGILSNNVNLLTFDDANNLWIGSEKGINKIIFELKDTLGKIKYIVNNVESYGVEDGLVGVETNQGAVLKDNDGNLWFGTVNGVSKYNPKADKFNVKPPKVEIKELKLNDEPTDWLQYADSIFPWNNLPRSLELKYNQNNLTIEYVGINLNVPHKVEYKLMLEGLDEDWTITYRDFVNYSNLPPGDYIFKVLAKNEDGIWQRKATVFKFSIDKPFWLKWWFIIIIILIVSSLIFLYIKRREAEIRKQNLLLEKTVNVRTAELKKEKENVEKINEEVEKKNGQILDSIQYAKKIQMAILPPDELVREKLPNFGIFYEAKDIVSGDFYWLTEENGIIYFATVDCTGHGVPGAFMSIVGYRLLELIINGYKIKEPAEALDELHMQVLETLHKQKGNAKDISDGMDIALCAWDRKTNKIRYAGAHNALYLIRNGELIEYKPNSRPIGMSMMKEFKNLEQEEIQLEKGDVVYIFTDGFADQFGGGKYRKYYYQNFQSFLISISHHSMDEQKKMLKEEFLNWKGDYEQIDDVLVFGVKF